MNFTALLTDFLITSLFLLGNGSQTSDKITQLASKYRARLRPFYIIGHMANTVGDVDSFLEDGANAVEVDIEFAVNGTVVGTHHDTFPCECFRVCGKRTEIKNFLKHIRNITGKPSSRYAANMTLLFLDLKTSEIANGSKLTAGYTLAQNLVEHLWNGVQEKYLMNVMLSIGYVDDKDVLKGAICYLKKNKYYHLLRYVGYDVGMNGNLSKIKHMYEDLGITRHRWQGDGLMNCFRFLIPDSRLLEAISIRDSPIGYIEKVYYWTVDPPVYIENAIRTTIDGIITNEPANALFVVKTTFANEVRVADRSDSPWKKFTKPRKLTTKALDDDDALDEKFIKGLLPKCSDLRL
ncbi:dermonecrotic toxin SPH [Rhipicephalus sanguineus]|uniref:dermonecrotic toxin SPH n=1 Tax=Rhipicephalus sanguineus TaxID=34632 RepID=UPI0018955B27|nr:dermonecrotic toxin SPH [Rhipicephalus sanguineus]